MRYEWDALKAAANADKHGVTFEMAIGAFDDPLCMGYPDWIDERGEVRWQLIGGSMVGDSAILLTVTHVYRKDEYGEDIIRIISARQADKKDIRRYQKQTLE